MEKQSLHCLPFHVQNGCVCGWEACWGSCPNCCTSDLICFRQSARRIVSQRLKQPFRWWEPWQLLELSLTMPPTLRALHLTLSYNYFHPFFGVKKNECSAVNALEERISATAVLIPFVRWMTLRQRHDKCAHYWRARLWRQWDEARRGMFCCFDVMFSHPIFECGHLEQVLALLAFFLWLCLQWEVIREHV